mgnify:CR=1 FL=1
MPMNYIDLFAGCGGLSLGLYNAGWHGLFAIEKNDDAFLTLKSNLIDKKAHYSWPEWLEKSSLDIYEVIKNHSDQLKKMQGHVDLVVGGPPCQAYSVAGRVRDENGMNDDYRNYLFEHYLNVVDRYKPRLFVFENVPGILSATPSGVPITSLIRKGFSDIGYEIIDDLKTAKVNAADYGVPQNRERVIIVGISKKYCNDIQTELARFYNEILPKYKSPKKTTVREAIDDLPVCDPFWDSEHHQKRKSHNEPISNHTWHKPRYHNLRDMDTFRILAEDIETGARKYDSKKISELYEMKIGSKSPIHRYHVLEADLPSTTIIAHLYKDGNRFIHYDSKQSRSITVREAARLQSFDDDFDFVGSQGHAYQMIGNAVPPLLAKNIALALSELLDEMNKE